MSAAGRDQGRNVYLLKQSDLFPYEAVKSWKEPRGNVWRNETKYENSVIASDTENVQRYEKALGMEGLQEDVAKDKRDRMARNLPSPRLK